MLPPLKKIIRVCESKENKRDFFFSHETYIKIIVVDLIIMKLFGVCLVVFPSRRKGFPCKYLCSYVRSLFWIVNIVDNIKIGRAHV